MLWCNPLWYEGRYWTWYWYWYWMWYCGILCGMRTGIGLVWNSVEWHVLVCRAMACFKQQKLTFNRKVFIIFPCVFCFDTCVANICHVLHLDLKCYTRKCKKKSVFPCVSQIESSADMCYRLIARVGELFLRFTPFLFFGQINFCQAFVKPFQNFAIGTLCWIKLQ